MYYKHSPTFKLHSVNKFRYESNRGIYEYAGISIVREWPQNSFFDYFRDEDTSLNASITARSYNRTR